MVFFRYFWLFFVGDEDERRARAKEISKHQAQQQQHAKEAAEFHHQAHEDTDDLPDDTRAYYQWATGKKAKEQRHCTVIFRGGGTLSFRHKNGTTLQLSVETDEDGQITRRTYDHLRKTYKETMIKKLTGINKYLPEEQK